MSINTEAIPLAAGKVNESGSTLKFMKVPWRVGSEKSGQYIFGLIKLKNKSHN